MRFVYVRPPKLIQLFFNDLIWRNNSQEILLTIDDGPHPEPTEIILKILNHNNIKALFLINGNIAKRNFNLMNEISSEGHFFGNHTENHLKGLNKLTVSQIKDEIIQTHNIISQFENRTNFFRPPYGKISSRLKRIVQSLNYRILMWTLLTEDYTCNFNRVRENIDRYLGQSSIIIFHNNYKSKSILHDSLNYLIDKSNERGLRFGTFFNL